MIQSLTSFLFPLFLVLLISCHSSNLTNVKRLFYRMDTVTQVVLAVPHSKELSSTWNSIDSILKDWEERFSETGQRSELQRLNTRISDTAAISPQLGEMIATALRYGDTTHGMFDITILPLKNIWGLGEQDSGNPPPPTSLQLSEILRNIDYHKVKLNSSRDTVYFLSRDVQVDIGGVAKGFVIREIERILNEKGINNYLISAGGDIAVHGVRENGSPWNIGIQHPRSTQRLLGTIQIVQGCIVTSGDYERYRIIDGKRVCHIFNPFTGYSCTRNSSLTLGGPDIVDDKILCTALFCLPADSILSFVKNRPPLQCVIVDSTGKIFISNGWKDRLKLE